MKIIFGLSPNFKRVYQNLYRYKEIEGTCEDANECEIGRVALEVLILITYESKWLLLNKHHNSKTGISVPLLPCAEIQLALIIASAAMDSSVMAKTVPI